jgi:hypothetical protein
LTEQSLAAEVPSSVRNGSQAGSSQQTAKTLFSQLASGKTILTKVAIMATSAVNYGKDHCCRHMPSGKELTAANIGRWERDHSGGVSI